MSHVRQQSVELARPLVASGGAPDDGPAPGAPERGITGAVARLPARHGYAIAAAMGRRRFRRAWGFLDDAIADIPAGLGLDGERLAEVARRNFELAACDQLDYAYFERLTLESLPRHLELRGLERLRACLEDGRGAILYSGHVRGHFMLFAALGLLGLRPNIIAMPVEREGEGTAVPVFARNEQLLRERFGCRFLFMAGGDFAVAARAANALRRGELVTVEIDHTHSARNLESTFLGRRARFPLGPLVLAQSTGAPMVPFWLHRPKRRTPMIAELGEPIQVGEDLDAALRECLRTLEVCIRAYPESWSTWLFPERNLWVAA
jgi:KDO2-lipid IV(A) lauroyltransferase